MSTADILLLGMEKQNVLSINKSTAFFIYLLIFISALNLGAYWAGNWKRFPPIWKSSNTVFTNSYSGYVVYKQKYLLRLWWVWIFCDIVISCEIMLTQILKYVKETTWYQRSISMYLSLSALGKKILCILYDRVLMASPIHRKKEKFWMSWNLLSFGKSSAND